MRSVNFHSILILAALLIGCEAEKSEVDFIELARFYHEQGSDQRAIAMLAAELEQNANNASAHQLMGTVLNRAGYHLEAVTHLQSAIELGCDQACALELVDGFLGSGQVAPAEQVFVQYFANEDSVSAKLRRVMIDFHTDKNYARAIERLKTIDQVEARDRILELMLEQKNFGEIIAVYREDEEYSEIQLLAYAQAHFHVGRYRTAEQILRKLNRQRRGDLLTRKKIESLDLQLRTFNALDKTSEAELVYQAFLDNYEDTSFVILQEAVMRLDNSDFDGAIEDINELVKRNPDSVQLVKLKAMAQRGKKNYRAVARELEPYKDQLNPRFLTLLAEAYNKTGRHRETIALLSDVEEPDAALTLTRAHLLDGSLPEARKAIANVSPQQDNVLFNTELARTWFEMGDYERLTSQFATMADSPAALKFLVAESHIKLGQVGAAKKFTAGEPNHQLALELSGLIAARTGQLEAAIETYRELSRQYPASRSYALLAWAYLAAGEFGLAFEAIRAGREIDANSRPLILLAGELLRKSNDTAIYVWLESLDSAHSDYRAAQLILASYDIERGQENNAVVRLAPLAKNADREANFLMAMAKRETAPSESIALLETGLSAGYSPILAETLHKHYVSLRDIENLSRINELVAANEGVNTKSARLLARGYDLMQQDEKLAELANTLAERGYLRQGKELEADILMRQRKFVEAAKLYERLIDEEASESILLKYFTNLFASERISKDQILEQGEKWLARKPDMDAFRNLVATQSIGHNDRAAIGHFELLIEKFPRDAVLLNNLAWAQLDIDPVMALEHSKRSYQASNGNPDILDTYARALIRNERKEQALELIDEGLRKYPDNSNLQDLRKTLK